MQFINFTIFVVVISTLYHYVVLGIGHDLKDESISIVTDSFHSRQALELSENNIGLMDLNRIKASLNQEIFNKKSIIYMKYNAFGDCTKLNHVYGLGNYTCLQRPELLGQVVLFKPTYKDHLVCTNVVWDNLYISNIDIQPIRSQSSSTDDVQPTIPQNSFAEYLVNVTFKVDRLIFVFEQWDRNTFSHWRTEMMHNAYLTLSFKIKIHGFEYDRTRGKYYQIRPQTSFENVDEYFTKQISMYGWSDNRFHIIASADTSFFNGIVPQLLIPCLQGNFCESNFHFNFFGKRRNWIQALELFIRNAL